MNKFQLSYLRKQLNLAFACGNLSRAKAIGRILSSEERPSTDREPVQKIKVTYPNGAVQIMDSAYMVTKSIGISHTALYSALDHGRPVLKGFKKGYQFEFVVEEDSDE